MQEFLVDYYRHAPFKTRHIDLYSRYFEALGAKEGPILIHCAAGKDRTGVLAALTQHLLGVSYDDSLVDYLLTNDPIRFERRLPLLAHYVLELTGTKPDHAFLRTSMGVERIYLDTAFAEIKAECGSIDVYLADKLGVDDELTARIRARLLV